MNDESTCINWISREACMDYCTAACEELGISLNPNSDSDWMCVVQEAANLLEDSWGGGDSPSPFKIIAAFAMAITQRAPIPETISEEFSETNKLYPNITRYPKAIAATIAFEMARDFLCGAKVGNSKNLKALTNPMKVSNHFYRDLIFTMAIGTNVGSLALIFEACCYQTNDGAQNGDRI